MRVNNKESLVATAAFDVSKELAYIDEEYKRNKIDDSDCIRFQNEALDYLLDTIDRSYTLKDHDISIFSDDDLLSELECRDTISGCIVIKNLPLQLNKFTDGVLSGKIKLINKQNRIDLHQNVILLMHFSSLISSNMKTDLKISNKDLVKITTAIRLLVDDAILIILNIRKNGSNGIDYYENQLIVIRNMLILQALELLNGR